MSWRCGLKCESFCPNPPYLMFQMESIHQACCRSLYLTRFQNLTPTPIYHRTEKANSRSEWKFLFVFAAPTCKCCRAVHLTTMKNNHIEAGAQFGWCCRVSMRRDKHDATNANVYAYERGSRRTLTAVMQERFLALRGLVAMRQAHLYKCQCVGVRKSLMQHTAEQLRESVMGCNAVVVRLTAL